MHKLRDQMLAAPEFFDPDRLPARFDEAQGLVRKAIDKAQNLGITDDTLAATLISEAVPRLVAAYGPAHAGRIVAMFAACLTAGAPTNDSLQ
ncbi:hypothetical protein [Undibacter mobilis]|uniref:Uncharacterized protein n=1 Tax=Undibacter mobilis TaxID=2292256 RepID=A0A371B0Z1_9BRAD|nr:hypothetical protein [Undibacter mobilis]RDV01246.1 hypothetical protein DXH78_18620 [Undibacter mobilis]